MHIIIKLKNGGVSIISVNKEKAAKDFEKHHARPPEHDLDLAEFEFEKSEGIIGHGKKRNRHLSWRIAADGEIPQDRYFRNAWKDSGALEIDLPKAREVHMDKIRIARDKKLKELDIEQLKGNDVTAEKQALRDIPQTFDLTQAATPEELKALWPANL